MKQYGKLGELELVTCNRCGKALKVEKGFFREGALEVEKNWGYFSRKDGQTHKFDLCEDCYDELLRGFLVPPAVEERTELI